MSPSFRIFGFATALLLLGGCKLGEQQDEFYEQANQAPSGYAETDRNGQIVKDDKDDWRTSPVFGGVIRVSPAYPNPITSGFVAIPVTVMQSNTIRMGLTLRAPGLNGRLVTLASLPEARDPGAYVFQFSAGLIGRQGLVRLFIFDGVNEIVSYGDLMIQ